MSIPRDITPAKSLALEVKELNIEESKDRGLTRTSRLSSVAMTDETSPPDAAKPDAPQRNVEDMSESPSAMVQSPAVKSEREEIIGGDITVKVEPGKAPKLTRKSSQKVVARPPPLYTHLSDATQEATSVFEVLPDCQYASRNLGQTEQALECDCTEEWDSNARINHACGEDSDCINRATKMECPGDCACGALCQNQRFQQKQYADVSVIKTEKKGYGLRTNKDLKPNDFIFEYIGEVIHEPAFRRRMHQYDQEGIKHFYFMSLTKSEFVDATKKGNLGRFCNHSCNPNCFVDKWVVGDKLRMGIFAERHIQAGEELVFNYNVDRYGADPQPCYCGEPNCSGFIGGKTQTDDDRATQLSNSVQLALGLYDAEDWNDAVAPKAKRKKKVQEDDEEYVDSVELKALDMAACVPLMAELYKNQEKWIIVKCLERIQSTADQKIRNRVAALHGYVTMNRILNKWIDDVNVVLQVFDVIHKIPSSTKNKIQDAKIEETVEKLKNSEDGRVKAQATELLEQWSKLEVAYRIPRVKRDPKLAQPEKRPDRRERDRSRSRSRSRSKSLDAPKAPSGPRNSMPQRGGFHSGPRPPFRPRYPNGVLPPGWFEAIAQNGSTYYYNASGATTWQRPTLPALAAPPPPPSKTASDQQVLQDIINNIVTKNKTKPGHEVGTSSASATPNETPRREKKEEKWRSYPIEKQKKLYENTLFPIVNQVMKDFRNKLEKEEIKRFGKEMAIKLVESDYKNNRVSDPTHVDSKTRKKVNQYVTQYFEKAVLKKKDREAKKKAEKMAQQSDGLTPRGSPPPVSRSPVKDDDAMQLDLNVIEDDEQKPPLAMESPSLGKRRREDQETVVGAAVDDGINKKLRTEQANPPPPPPPPPPSDSMKQQPTTELERTPSEEPINDSAAEREDDGPGFTIKGIARTSSRPGESPVQVATPPTTGSPDGSEREKRRREYTGMNPDRMRLIDGGAGR